MIREQLLCCSPCVGCVYIYVLVCLHIVHAQTFLTCWPYNSLVRHLQHEKVDFAVTTYKICNMDMQMKCGHANKTDT